MDLVIGGRHFSCLVIAEQMQVIIETNPSHYRMNVETFRQSRPHHAIGKSFWFSDDNWQRTVNNQNWFLDLKKFAQMLHGIKMFFSVAEIMFRAQHLGLIPLWCLLPLYCAVLNLLLVVSKSNVRLNTVFLGRIDCKCIQFDIERRVVVVQFSLSKNHLLLFHQSGMKLK